MRDFFNVLVALILGSLGLSAFFVALNTLFPYRIAKTWAAADAMPGRSLGFGVINFLFFGAIAFALFGISDQLNNDALRVVFLFPALVCVALLGMGLSFGLAGVVQLVGQRLMPEQGGWRHTIMGTLVLGWACALPFVGWFGLLPYAGLLGLGAFIVGFFSREGNLTPSLPARSAKAQSGEEE